MLKNGKLINGEARVENTNRCNTHCIICPRDRMTRPLATMEYGFFTNIVDQVIELGASNVSVFGYGEPLMDKNISEKILYCSSKGLETYVTTNGCLLDMEKSMDLIYAGLKNLRFSIHAITPLNYERVHKQNWLRTFGNFYTFCDINEKHGHPCKVHISTIPMHGESVDEVRKTWEKYADYLEVWKPHNWSDKMGYRVSEPKKNTCGRPFNGPLQVQADGSVIPCCFLTNSEIVLGNTNNNYIKDILDGGPYKELRERHTSGELDGLPCKTCDQRNESLESPLLYSNRDPSMSIGRTSTAKISFLKGEN